MDKYEVMLAMFLILAIVGLATSITYEKAIKNVEQKYELTQHGNMLMIAKTICAEACSEGRVGLLAVTNTIYNRMKLQDISAYKVISAPAQYSGFTHPNIDKIWENYRDKRYIVLLIENMERLPDITKGAIFFLDSSGTEQKWHKEVTLKTGDLTFYK